MRGARYGGSELWGGGAYWGADIVEGEDNVIWLIEVDWNNDGTYDGGNEASWAISLETTRGREYFIKTDSSGKADGFEPIRTGKARITLDNLDGRYDPYNTSSDLYPNVLPGRKVRILVQETLISTPKPVIEGYLVIRPFKSDRSRAFFEIVDGLEYLKQTDINIELSENVATHTSIHLILDAAGWPTADRDIDISEDVRAYWWADRNALLEIRELASASLGTFFISADGKATYHSRNHSAAASFVMTQAEFIRDVWIPLPWDVVRNYIKVIAHPLVLQSVSTLWTLGDVPLAMIAGGASIERFGSYTYEGESSPAINVIAPAPTTDFTVTENEDGSGADLTSSVTRTFYDFGSTGKVTLSLGGGTNGYLQELKIRGEAVASPDATFTVIEDAASQNLYQQQTLILDNRWLQSSELANSIAIWLSSWLPQPQPFFTVKVIDRFDEQFDVDLFDVFSISFAHLGVATQSVRIGYVKHKWLNPTGQITQTTFKLEPFLDLSGYWTFPTKIGDTAIFSI